MAARIVAVIAVALAALSALLAWASPEWLETLWWGGAWTWWSAAVGAAQRSWRWSLSLTLLPASLLIGLGWAMWQPPRRRRAAAAVATWLLLLALTFIPTWGGSYRRAPVAERLELSLVDVDAATLLRAMQRLSDAMVAALPAVDTSEVGAAPYAAAVACVAEVDAVLSGRRLPLVRSVRTLPAGTLLRAGYAGVALPWLLEPHVDAGLPPVARLATATHELVHTAGWGRESDTDAIALLASLACDDPTVRYAGAWALWFSLYSMLADTNLDAHHAEELTRLLEALPERARTDRSALVAAAAHYRSPRYAALVSAVYDRYLRAQGVRDGLADYSGAAVIVAAALERCEATTLTTVDTGLPWCR